MKNRRLWVSILAGVLAGVMLLSLIISLIPQKASAASSSEIKKQIEALEGDQAEMQEQIEALKAQQDSNLSDIRALAEQKSIIEQQVGLIHAQVDSMNEQIAAYAVLIADKQTELDDAETHLAELNAKNKERIRAMEESGKLSYWSVLFKASSFSDLLDRINIVNEIAAADRRRLEEMRTAAQEVADAKTNLEAERADLELAKEELAVKQTELEAKEQEAKAALDVLLARGEEYDLLVEEQELELSKMEEEIAKAEKKYDAAKYQEWLATSVPPTTKPKVDSYGGGTGGSGVTKGDIVWLVPCDYNKVSSGWGWREHPVYGGQRFHHGVDLSAPCPTKIYATRAGVVVTARYSTTAGNYVTIDHGDGYTSTYMHMCEWPYVKEGQFVAAGQVLGCVGTTGTSTGNHLHFGIYYNGSSVDPMLYIK